MLVALLLAACAGVEEKRVRQLLVEKGFGTVAQGVAAQEDYIGAGDGVIFYFDPALALTPGMERLALLATPQTPGLDGTIWVPYVGPVKVLGMTARELGTLLSEQLQAQFKPEILIECRVISAGKGFYAFGETMARGWQPFLKPDFTVMEAIARLGTTDFANLGRVRLVRPDAQNPLVVVINFREMVLTGNTTYNLTLQENDILYVPATFFGTVARFMAKLLQPLGLMVNAVFGFASVRSAYEYLQDPDAYGLYFPPYYGGGYYRF